MSEADIDKALSSVSEKSDAVNYNFYSSWKEADADEGDFQGFGDFTMTESNKTMVMEQILNYTNRDLSFTVVFDTTTDTPELTSMTFDKVYSLGEKMGKAGMITLMGIVTVFVILILISIIFYALSTVSNGVLQGIGKVNIPLRNAAVSLVLHVVLLTPLLYFTNLNLYALVFATMFYAFLMCLLNNLSVRKYLGYHQEMKRTFMIPLLSSVIMGILCYVFYQGIYLILSGIFGSFIHLRILVFICLMISVGFAVIVYFVLVLKLKGITEAELRNFPKGNMLVRMAKKSKLL